MRDAERGNGATLAWLAQVVAEPSWTDAPASQASVAGRRAVVDCVALWLSLVEKDDPAAPALRAAVEEQVLRLRAAKSMTGSAYANWIEGFTALAAAEYPDGDPGAGRALRAVARGCAQRQNSEGGWGHGEAIDLPFYPSTLVATTNLAALALGVAQRRGIAADADALGGALSLLRSVQSPDGAMPYGGRAYLKIPEAGRTAAALVALAAAKHAGDAGFARAARYVCDNVAAIPDGHASPSLHVMLGALACSMLGDETWSAFDAAVLARVRAARKDDGTYADIVAGSPDTLELMGDARTRTAYISALLAAAQAAPRSRLIAKLRRELRPVATKARAGFEETPLAAAWSRQRAGVRHCVIGGGRLVLTDAAGAVEVLDLATGRTLARAGDAALAACERPIVDGVRAVVYGTGADAGLRVFDLAASARRAEVDAGAEAPEELRVLWKGESPGPYPSLRAAEGSLLVLKMSGRVGEFDLESGRERRSFALKLGEVNRALLVRPDGWIVAGDAEVARLDAAGDEVWRRRAPRKDGIVPPSYTAIAGAGDGFVTGATDGTVRGWTAEGKAASTVTCPSAIQALAPVAGGLLAATADGAVHLVRDGALAWSQRLAEGRESVQPLRVRRVAAGAWVSSPGSERLVLIDGEGAITKTLRLPPDAAWDAADDLVVVARDGRLAGLRY